MNHNPQENDSFGALMRQQTITSGHGEGDVVPFTEVDGQYGVGGGVVAEPVGAVVQLRPVDAHHEVTVQQHLQMTRYKAEVLILMKAELTNQTRAPPPNRKTNIALLPCEQWRHRCFPDSEDQWLPASFPPQRIPPPCRRSWAAGRTKTFSIHTNKNLRFFYI